MYLELATSTAYRMGQYTALVVLLVAIVWCVRQALSVHRGGGAANAGSPAPGTPGVFAADSSVAPPGFAPAASSNVLSNPGPTRRETSVPAGRSRYAIGAVLATVLFAAGVVSVAGGGGSDPWATQAGVDMRAGFLDACGRTAGNVVNCQCVFSHLTAQAPYNTPQGFVSLASDVSAYVRTGDRSAIPAIYVSSLQACRIN